MQAGRFERTGAWKFAKRVLSPSSACHTRSIRRTVSCVPALRHSAHVALSRLSMPAILPSNARLLTGSHLPSLSSVRLSRIFRGVGGGATSITYVLPACVILSCPLHFSGCKHYRLLFLSPSSLLRRQVGVPLPDFCLSVLGDRAELSGIL